MVLYFLDPEGKPIDPAPTVASLKPRERGVPTVTFKPAEGGALESPPFKAGGELSATVGGKPVAITIGVR